MADRAWHDAPITDTDRDELRELLGPCSYTDDLVFAYLAHSTHNPVTERQLLVALVKRLVDDRAELKKQVAKLAQWATPPVRFPVDDDAGFLADAECDRLGKLLTDAVRELDSAPCQHCGAPLSTPGHRMVTRDPRIDRDEPLDGKVKIWLTCEVGGKAER